MKTDKSLETFDSLGSRYERAFKLFLANTDQKVRARVRLEELVGSLARRENFIDVGAGTGILTQWLADHFHQSIGIEPNLTLTEDFKKNCPGIELITDAIDRVNLPAMGDLVLCSHVFYYLDKNTWMDTIQKLSSWVSPDGMFVNILQNPQSDCMKMLRHFMKHSFDLPGTMEEFEKSHGDRYRVTIKTVPSIIETKSLADATGIAEFVLNLIPSHHLPAEAEVRAYVEKHFKHGENQYRYSCDQDFVIVRKR